MFVQDMVDGYLVILYSKIYKVIRVCMLMIRRMVGADTGGETDHSIWVNSLMTISNYILNIYI